MSVKAVFARRALVLLVVVLSLFTRATSRAQSVSLAWDPSPSPAGTGYKVFYGLASGDYTSFVDAGTNTDWTLSGLTTGNIYFIAVLAYGTNGNESPFSDEVVYGVSTFPLIAIQPLAQTVNAGETVSFAVSAVGAGPLTYQWYDGAAPLAGATNDTLTLPNVSDPNAGKYSVVIANSSGSVTSSVVALAVVDQPVITIQPEDQIVTVGATASFAVSAVGAGPLTYQWYDGAAALSGATNATLTLPNVSNANVGNYSVVVANSAGSVTSSVVMVTLDLLALPLITTQPVSQTVPAGGIVLFNVSVQGTGPFTYQWLHNGTTLASGGLNYLLVMAIPANLGNYSVMVANNGGCVTSSAAALQTPGPPLMTLTRSGNSVVVSWPSPATGFALQQNANLATTNWTTSGYAITTNGGTASITIPSTAGNMFFRLCNSLISD